MATIDHTIAGAWTPVAAGPGQASVTSYMLKAKFSADASVPTLNPAVAGHILPLEETVTIPLAAGETLWVHGEGHVSVDVSA